MNKLLKYLRSPYPVFYQRWKITLISSAIVFLILVLLQPFGISNIQHNKLLILIGYMAVTALSLCIPVYLLPFLFPRYYREENWTVGKYLINILFIFFFISVGNWLYSALLFGHGLFLWAFSSFLIVTTVIGIFPVGIFVLLNRNRLLASHLQEAMEMNLYLQKAAAIVAGGEMPMEESDYLLSFQGGSKELLELDAQQLCCVESEGNYVKVTYRKEEKTVQRLLRATMKQAEEVTEDCPFVVKCHRAFLVNVRAVTKVSGNSQGYRLTLQGCEFDVPVSRAYAKEVRMLIECSNDG